MTRLNATASCGGCKQPLLATMVVKDGVVNYDPARWLIYSLSDWYMEYFAPNDRLKQTPILYCPRCNRLLSYLLLEGTVDGKT